MRSTNTGQISYHMDAHIVSITYNTDQNDTNINNQQNLEC